ncbi:hypothetical protein ACDX78_19270 [Virgibacillus oceani]
MQPKATSGQENAKEIMSMNEETAELALKKIDHEVIEAFGDQQYVEVLIEMDEKVNTSQAAEQGIQMTADTATEYKKKMAARNGVYNELKSTAQRTQAAALDILEKAKDDGEVNHSKAFTL